ncbi:TPA: hypothetical protein N0F65_005699 [Lagenidium giganteum]|uniref:RNase H type-1 domain-containing protein n=1 Tax=Lagenidium giganteum TaxID=4803 RepID=A0AAV2ZF44_9STRA|nr:TPA: hypothetical protein N0F65_005699 [Lagenidium giganteum]
MDQGRCPKAPRLRKQYRIAHALRQGFCQCTWRHQRRHHNKMADALASLALDRQATTLISASNPIPASICHFLPNDKWPAQYWHVHRDPCGYKAKPTDIGVKHTIYLHSLGHSLRYT